MTTADVADAEAYPSKVVASPTGADSAGGNRQLPSTDPVGTLTCASSLERAAGRRQVASRLVLHATMHSQREVDRFSMRSPAHVGHRSSIPFSSETPCPILALSHLQP